MARLSLRTIALVGFFGLFAVMKFGALVDKWMDESSEPNNIWCDELQWLGWQLPEEIPKNITSQRDVSRIARRVHQIVSELPVEEDCPELMTSLHMRLEKIFPTIYIITSTYTRLVQKAELVRMSTVLQQVPNVFWVVIEDAPHKTFVVKQFLAKCRIPHVHLNATGTGTHGAKPKGLISRNHTLRWMRNTLLDKHGPSVIYIADDDNTYSLELFEEMRYIKKIGVWPVGLVGTLPYEGPVVKNGKVHSWFSGFLRTSREYPIDMAGFAFTGKFLLQHPQAMFQFNDQPGVMENDFLATMNIKKEDFEPKADNCTKILVWHTKTQQFNPDRIQSRVETIVRSLHEEGVGYQPILSDV